MAEGRQCNNQPNKRGSMRGKAGTGRHEATQQPAKLEELDKKQMRNKRWQLDERRWCLLT
jgi:hypothetical protein